MMIAEDLERVEDKSCEKCHKYVRERKKLYGKLILKAVGREETWSEDDDHIMITVLDEEKDDRLSQYEKRMHKEANEMLKKMFKPAIVTMEDILKGEILILTLITLLI